MALSTLLPLMARAVSKVFYKTDSISPVVRKCDDFFFRATDRETKKQIDSTETGDTETTQTGTIDIDRQEASVVAVGASYRQQQRRFWRPMSADTEPALRQRRRATHDVTHSASTDILRPLAPLETAFCGANRQFEMKSCVTTQCNAQTIGAGRRRRAPTVTIGQQRQ